MNLILNPKAMDHKIEPFEVFTTTPINVLNENNDDSNDTTNGKEQWGKNGGITQLMNIVATQKKLEINSKNR
jgi:hypothetical protein